MREPATTAPDRRQTPRTKLAEIAYIGMGPENGGLVLDVSDGGLSFHSVAPVQPAQTIEFLLSLRGHSRIEGAGEVVWTNNMKTICGLKFTSLSSAAREHLNNWTNLSKMPARETVRPPRPVMQSESAEPPEVPLKEIAEPVFAIPPAFNSPLTEPGGTTLWREPLFLWILFLLMGSAVGMTAYKYGIQEGRTQMAAVARSLAGPETKASPETTPTAPVPNSPAANQTRSGATSAPSVSGAVPFPSGTLLNASKTDDASGGAGQNSGSDDNSGAAAQRTEQQQQAGQSELAAAQSYLTVSGANRDTVKAARLLWAAVGNGNTTAEVLLADLYLRGDGVTKSCEQGRILLVAAIKSGNIEAQSKLRDLNATGCQ